jgi:hypothetical protein
MNEIRRKRGVRCPAHTELVAVGADPASNLLAATPKTRGCEQHLDFR